MEDALKIEKYLFNGSVYGSPQKDYKIWKLRLGSHQSKSRYFLEGLWLVGDTEVFMY